MRLDVMEFLHRRNYKELIDTITPIEENQVTSTSELIMTWSLIKNLYN
jgi:hypothetical protein